MPDGNEKDEFLTAPIEDAQRPTPHRTPTASGETPPELPSGSLHALRQRYDILAEVGRGGMGIVYKARDRETGAVVALKVLRPEIAAHAAVIERFKSELLLARKITHKNVCRIYELLRFGDAVAIAMEFVEGESLRAFLNRLGGVPLRRGLEWAKEICGALGEAHAQGVVHRDLKPENIFIDGRGHAKVMDFGIARSVESTLTQTGSTFGTPAYMSPEQAEGKAADARSDIYALGLIFYEMFAGRAPFQADTPVSFALKQIHETPPPPRSVEPYLPLFLDRAIQHCLEKNPAKRFQSAEELSAALAEQPEAVVSVVEPTAKETPLPDHLATWQRRDWGLLAGALVGFVLFFVLFDQVFPYGAVASSVSREEVINISRRIVEKYAPELKDRPYAVKEAGYSDQLGLFPLNVIYTIGLRLSIKVLLEWDPGLSVYQNAPPVGISIAYNHQGQPLQLTLPSPSRDQMPKEIPSQEEVLPLATQAAGDIFGVHLAGIAPVSLNCDHPRGCRTSDNWEVSSYGPGLPRPVVWNLPSDIPETKIYVQVNALPGRVLYASESLAGPNKNESQAVNRWYGAEDGGTLVLWIYGLLCFILTLALRVYRQTSRMVWVASFIMAVAVVGIFWSLTPGAFRFHEEGGCWCWKALPHGCSVLPSCRYHIATF